MSKVGAGLDAQRIQVGGITQSPSDTIRKVLSKSLDELTMSGVEIEPTQELEEVPSALPQATPTDLPVDTGQETAGFTPEGEMLPLKERFENQRDGIVRPEFDQWSQTGSDISPDYLPNRNYGTDNDSTRAKEVQAPRSPVNDMFSRATRMASMMNPLDDSTPTIRVRDTNVTGARSAEYKKLNSLIAMSIDPDEQAALRRRRYELADADNRESTILGSYLEDLDAMKIDPETGMATPDPRFLATGAIATEHQLDQMFLGTNDEYETVLSGEPDEKGNVQTRSSAELINPADSSERVGREVVKWWAAEKRARGEQPPRNMNSQKLKDVGAMFQLAYAKANPHIVSIVKVKDDGTGRFVRDETGTTVRFELKPEGNAIYDANRPARDEAMGLSYDPLTTPQPGLTGAAQRERPAFRNEGEVSGSRKKDPAYATLDEFHESIENQNGVAHVVDNRRTRIVSAMALPALFGKLGDRTNIFADFFGVGRASMETVRLEKMHLNSMDEAQAFDESVKIMNVKKRGLAESLLTAVKFMGRPNYLTFAMQPLTGRMMVQQDKFNPTSDKVIRFVTRSKHPATIRDRGSALGKAYLHAMALSFGNDSALTKGRFDDIRQNADKYYNWGKKLEQILDEVLPKDAFESVVSAIRNNQPVPPQVVEGMRRLQEVVNSDPELLSLLQDKGEDAPMAIDALIDFKNFEDNMRSGRPHTTFINAYVDGKTNGTANQGMMLGNRELAVRVGAIRSENATEAVDGGDIRKAMASLIDKRVEEEGFPTIPSDTYAGDAGKYADIKWVLQKLGTSRTINKQISMIFPYGKEIGGMLGEIRRLIPELRASDPELDARMESLNMDEEIIKAAHDNVVYSLFDIFGEDTFNTRGIMRSVGFMHAVTDKLFSIRGPAGHRILLGDKRVESTPKSKSTVVVSEPYTTDEYRNPDIRKMGSALNVQQSPTYWSSAARKKSSLNPMGEPAGYVRGRAAVIPTQAFDAATVVRTSTGKSWDRLKKAHPAQDPYFFQIYDAYKADLHSLIPLVEEVNQNFVDLTTRDWNFVDEARKEYSSLRRTFENSMRANPDATYGLQGAEFDYVYDLLDPDMRITEFGHVAQRRTLNTFVKAAFPIDPNFDYSGPEPKRAAKKPTPQDVQEGYEAWISKKTGEIQSVLHAEFNKYATAETGKISQSAFINSETSPKLINSAQALAIFNALERETKLSERLSKLSEKTNRNRAKLRNEIIRDKRRGGWGALQFWAH